ncbi:MAG: ribonuclease E/G, partial [Rhodospirillaceae bacterium]
LESTAPAKIYEEGNLIKRSIRDLYSREIDEVFVEGEAGYRMAKDFMKLLTPSHAKKVQPYREESMPLFHRYQVESQLDAMHSPTAQLRSGGYIVINQTEALVAIDVNSGRSTRERNIEDTAYKTNLEAADEIARQLRLRDLSGLIVIDFIDMEDNRSNTAVERRLKDALKSDRARIQVGRISHFGLLELSRQRLRPSIMETSFLTCPHCQGTGVVRSLESAAVHTLRIIEEEGVRRRSSEITLYLPTEVALYILNQKRDVLAGIEDRYCFKVYLQGDASLVVPDYRMERIKQDRRDEKDGEDDRTERSDRALPAPPRARDLPPEDSDEDAEGDTEAETDEDNARSDDGDGSRRRKRRRRRRGRRDSEGVEGEADGNGGDEASEGDAGDSEDSEETDDDGGDNRRRRRRRRGRGRYRSDSDAGDGSTDGEGQTAEADGDSQAQDNDSSEDSGEQDRRGRRRRRRKRTGDNPASHGGGQSEYGQPAVDPFSGSIPADPDAIAEAMESGALTPTADITSDPVAVPYPMDADSIVEAQSGEAPATSPAQDEVAEVEPDLPLATDPEPIEEAAPESVPEAEVEALEEAVEEAVKEAPGLETEAAAEPAEEPEPAVAMAAEPADVEVQADDPKKPARTGWWQRIVS